MRDVTEYISHNCATFPDRLAVIEEERALTYGEFGNLVTHLSAVLQDVKAKPKVAIDLPQGIEAYALITAVLNVGGTYCPLNPESPSARKSHIVHEFDPDLIVVRSVDQSFEGFNISEIAQLIDRKLRVDFRRTEFDPSDTSYVIYTSGSTGLPKGVMIYRKALNKFLEWSIPTYDAGEFDKWGQFSSLSFDLSIVDIFTCLCSGATLIALGDPSSKLMPSIAIEKYGITIWHSVPSAVDFMIKREETRHTDLSSLRLLSFCGEPLRVYHLDFLYSKNESVTVFNTYGPTEGTLFCTWEAFERDTYAAFGNTSMSIGKPIPGWDLFLRPFDHMAEREIVIHGDYIGKGYLNEPEDSGFRKIEIDAHSVPCFETRDLVIEKGGNLFFQSRKDRQVKIKGNRVELGEIDYWLRKLLKTRSETVVYEGTLYSFVETQQPISEDSVRDYLAANLESYKIPAAFIPISELPRNANLKINVNELYDLICDKRTETA